MHLFVPRNGIWREVPRRWRWSYLVAVALFAVIGILGCFTGGWPILIFALIYGLTRVARARALRRKGYSPVIGMQYWL